MGAMKELYNKYAEEWDNHDCKRDDPGSGCPCTLFKDFEEYADGRYEADMETLRHITEEAKCLDQLSAIQSPPNDPPDPADPPTWNQVNADPADPAEVTVPIDLNEVDEQIAESDGFTMREPNRLEKLKLENAKRGVGNSCCDCGGTLQSYGRDSFCGKCEMALEKKSV